MDLAVVVFIVFVGWVVWRLWPETVERYQADRIRSKFDAISGVHEIPVPELEARATIKYEAALDKYDITHLTRDGETDIWSRLSAVDKAVVQVDIQLYIADLRKTVGLT